MATATLAADLRARHPEAAILVQLDVVGDGGLVEARPPGAGVELRVRGEQLGAAAGTPVGPVVLRVDVLAGERMLGRVRAQYRVLLGGELRLPLLVGQVDLGVGGP